MVPITSSDDHAAKLHDDTKRILKNVWRRVVTIDEDGYPVAIF
jgi:hypothetical protein